MQSFVHALTPSKPQSLRGSMLCHDLGQPENPSQPIRSSNAVVDVLKYNNNVVLLMQSFGAPAAVPIPIQVR